MHRSVFEAIKVQNDQVAGLKLRGIKNNINIPFMCMGGEDGVVGGAGLRYYRCGGCRSNNRNFWKLLSEVGEQFIAGLLSACSARK